jgi:NAD(P)-dependent dehydrogenase (short-subunit alcohol dehydrogenase family)
MFGVGVLVKECFPQLVLSIGRQPDFFCDNAPEKWGTELFSIKCLSPAQLGDLADDTVVVITVKSYEAISRQLYGMGIKHVFAVFFDRSYNSVRAVKKIEKEQSSAPPPALGSSPLRGKWTLITGASRGAGRQIALAMAGLGSNIIAHSRCVSHVSGLVHECSALGVEIAPIVAELSNPDQLETMLSELEHLVPRVDIIFNNAAIPCQSGFWSSPSRDYLECYAVNAVAPIRICRQLIPPMIERGYGRVVNVTSSVQKRLETMAYACSKAALDKFVHDLAPSLEGTGVAISLVDPGWLRTDMTGFDGPHAVESIIPGVLLGVLLDGDINGRWFTAQDYAGLSIEAAMEKAKFVFDPIGVQNLDHAVQEAK